MEENNSEKNLNIVIVIVIVLVILGIGGLSFACYKIIQKDKEKTLVKNNLWDIQTSNNEKEENEHNKDNIIVGKNENSIQQLLIDSVDRFNSSYFTKGMNENENIYMKANIMGNSINIFIQGWGEVVNITWALENNILISKVISYDGADPYILSTKALCASIFMDCVAQVKGYDENQLMNELSKEKSMYFTVENEGVEIEVMENDGGLIFKIDLNSELDFLRK